MRFEVFRRSLVEATRRQLATGQPTRLPEGAELIWSFFVELSSARTYNAAGPNPIAFSEIEAWARLMRWPIGPHHAMLIRAIDETWLEHVYADRARKAGNSPRATPSQPIQAEFFDAMFGG